MTYGSKGGGLQNLPNYDAPAPFLSFFSSKTKIGWIILDSTRFLLSYRLLSLQQMIQILSLERLDLYSVIAKVPCSQDIRSQERTCVISAPDEYRVPLLPTSLNSQDGNLHFQVKMMINTGFRELEKEHMSLCK